MLKRNKILKPNIPAQTGKAVLKLLILFSFFTISCSDPLGLDDNVKTTIEFAEIKPLVIGNYWEYQVNGYDDGKEAYSYVDRFRIVDTIAVSGGVWFIEEHGDEDIPLVNYFQNREDGLWKSSGNPGEPGHEISIMVPYPFVKGSEFVVSTNQSGESIQKIIRKVEEVDVSIATPAGTFRCIKYGDYFEYNGTREDLPRNVLYYAPRTGWIKTFRYVVDNGLQVLSWEYILTDYHLE